jgi:hypothetical protein
MGLQRGRTSLSYNQGYDSRFRFAHVSLITIVNILDRSRRILKDKTPEEAFIGKKQQVSHNCVFGCPMC